MATTTTKNSQQNNKKLATVRTNADAQMSQKAVEKMNVFENKLFIAEQNREKELQKKLDSIRRHVGFLFSFLCFNLKFENLFCHTVLIHCSRPF